MKASQNLQLQWLPTHVACNSDYRRDEELFVLNAAFMAGASDSAAADAVLADIRRGLLKGQQHGLFLSIGPQFKPSQDPDGPVTFTYDGERTLRVVWKLVRGLYMLQMGQPLHIDTPHHCYPLIAPFRAQEQLQEIGWMSDLLSLAPSLGRYKDVFDYRWLGLLQPEQPALRAHGFALLLWDRVVAPVLMHDLTCGCRQCSAKTGFIRADSGPTKP